MEFIYEQDTRDAAVLSALNQGLLRVDPENGIVYGRRRGRYAARLPLVPVGFLNSCGYLSVNLAVDGVRHTNVSLHRIVWLSVHGFAPKPLVLDHIDRNKQNNRISNLRLATCGENAANVDR